ncbi:hemolysin III family protein [Amaricoccus sp.]|uniref:PAQR family membrane homeostasis protein TrhA n=1 Tax=Amaricoccus sp. TaxID=1872485 RepID=UPI001B3FB50E|nr:hemolysin III family protein [Amaricoccus sp.]MBP7001508.1 hemolysin III family protein [Amaricoccus sp.]
MGARNFGGYSRAERLSDAVVHVAGVTFGVAAAGAIVTLAAVWEGAGRHLAAAAVYGFCLVAMLACSALYHMTPAPEWKDRLRRLDQSAIYLKIAGAYTPFAVMTGPQAMPFLAGLWAVAAAGVSLKLLSARQLFGLTVALYLAMGWAAVLVGGPVLERMTPEGYRLVLTAGALYTIGVAFLCWDRLPFHVTIWHLFVLAGSLSVYAALVIELRGVAA